MRDEVEGSAPGPGRPPTVPPPSVPAPATGRPGPPAAFPGPPAAFPGRPPGAEPRPRRSRRAPPPRRSRRAARPRRWPRALLAAGLLAGLAGLAVSARASIIQFLPRTFSPAQRSQIMAWEVAQRWRTWPAGRIFPPAVGYELPGSEFGGGPPLGLRAERVGIAAQATCRAATDRAARQVLARRGCLAVLRATYEDTTRSFAVTVGVAVLPTAPAAQQSAASPGRTRPWVRPVPFRRTPAAHFTSPGGKLGWRGAAGPYLVLATVGYADGRPWLAQGHDGYTQTEMLSLASGVGRSVASRLGAAPPVPRCPGSPGC